MSYLESHEPTVQILLSTYNGEAWLFDLWGSLLKQSWTNWELIVRDDGSSDRTFQILKAWEQQYPNKIHVLNNRIHKGSQRSYSQLVEYSTAKYLMFCDQDDRWQPHKISIQMGEITAQEQQYGRTIPLLVHTDLEVTDRAFNTLHSSFWRFKRFKLGQSRKKYFVQNTVTGNTCLFNRIAADLAFPVNNDVMEHDRWLALVVAWFGVIKAIDIPLVRYRQHQKNKIGAFSRYHSVRKSVDSWGKQARYFLERYANYIDQPDKEYIAAIAQLHQSPSKFRRWLVLWKKKIRKDGIIPNLALWIWA